jgi:hypothetical protein
MTFVKKVGLFDSLRWIYLGDSFFKGDISFLGNYHANNTLKYLPVYDYIFKRKNDIIISKLDSDSKMILSDYRSKHGEHVGHSLLQDNITGLLQKSMRKKNLKNLHVVSSFIPFSKKNKLKHFAKHRALEAEIKNTNLIDLGDSRNFQNAQEIIEKIKLIEDSMCYVGSHCSWSDISMLYNKPVITISEREEVQ